MKISWKQQLGDGSVVGVRFEMWLGLCSPEERKEPDSCLHVPRAAIVFCKSVFVSGRGARSLLFGCHGGDSKHENFMKK